MNSPSKFEFITPGGLRQIVVWTPQLPGAKSSQLLPKRLAFEMVNSLLLLRALLLCLTFEIGFQYATPSGLWPGHSLVVIVLSLSAELGSHVSTSLLPASDLFISNQAP